MQSFDRSFVSILVSNGLETWLQSFTD